MGTNDLTVRPGVAGETRLCMVSKGGHLAYRSIAEFHRLWHVGTADRLPPPLGKGYVWAPRLRKWRAAVSYQGKQHYLGLYLSEAEAKQAVAEFRATHPCHRTRKLAAVRRNHVRCVDETTLIAARTGIRDVEEYGRTRLLRITTVGGKSITCSPDQAILTPEGHRPAGSLAVGATVLVAGRTVLPSKRRIPPSLRTGIGVWTSMQRGRLIADVDRCYLCGDAHKRADLVLDHEIPVVMDLLKALDERNLRPACAPCHRIKSNSEQSLGKRNGSTSVGKNDVVDGITRNAAGPVYGLVIDVPPNNYLADGVYVGAPTA